MERMRNATFCLSMPGDSASTRRLSETIMAGCIPVFIGSLHLTPASWIFIRRSHQTSFTGACSSPKHLDQTEKFAWPQMLSDALLLAGPPYATMPMAEDVDYRAFSVFINITDYSGWLQDRMEWEIHSTIRPYHVLNPWTWLPEVGGPESNSSSCVGATNQ